MIRLGRALNTLFSNKKKRTSSASSRVSSNAGEDEVVLVASSPPRARAVTANQNDIESTNLPQDEDYSSKRYPIGTKAASIMANMVDATAELHSFVNENIHLIIEENHTDYLEMASAVNSVQNLVEESLLMVKVQDMSPVKSPTLKNIHQRTLLHTTGSLHATIDSSNNQGFLNGVDEDALQEAFEAVSLVYEVICGTMRELSHGSKGRVSADVITKSGIC